ncbi:hypothetical protein PHLGIDRAFT_20586, partial [Phlebiopsis gigantea 11061_1 CR5-6]
MPSLELVTNVKLNDPKAFVVEFSGFSAELLKKPLQYICVTYTYNENMAWNATFDPAFLLHITSLDNLNPEANVVYSEKIFEFVEAKLHIPGHRGYISFSDPGRENLGHAKTTCAIFASL